MRYFGKTMSGLHGRLRTCSRNRKPSRCAVLLTIFSGVVSRPWTLAMIWLRFSLENMSVTVRPGFYHHDALCGLPHSLPYAAMVLGQAFKWAPRRDELRIRVLLPRYPYILEPACIILSQIRDWGFWGAVAAPWSHPFIKSLIISQPSFASIRIPPRSVVVRVGSAPSSQIHAIGPHQNYLQNHHGWVVY